MTSFFAGQRGRKWSLLAKSAYNHFMDTVRIVLVSDNHGDRKGLQYLRETYADYDYFVHCGDSEMSIGELEGFICVRGNNDFPLGNDAPDQTVLEAGGHRIYICHGHMDFLSYFHYEPLARRAQARGCDTVFFGHVHKYDDETVEGVRLLNPGSLRHNRDGSAPSYMLVHINEDGILAQRMEYVPAGKTGEDSWLDKLIGWLSRL